jgi:primosomal protein N' (replication factor Y)
MNDLGLIILDEEHEASFKQDEKLKYHARDAAIMLAKLVKCPIILGSATPSLESYWNAQQGRFKYHRIESRVAARPMPLVTLVDLRDVKAERQAEETFSELPFWMSPHLFKRMEHTLKNKKQVALFLNRRGIAQSALCSACGFVYECPNCEIGLVLHGKDHLLCHYCEFTERLTEKCKSCGNESVETIGLGTELIENDLKRLFPNARIARADRDEIQSREHLEEMVQQMETGETDILVGTQMIAKGLDFPKLNLVGLVLADIGFNLPDFRAAERSFQLLTQVAGRAGRHSEEPGEVIVQTFNPQHASIQFSQTHDYLGFATQELESRKEVLYPPFARLAMIRLQASSFQKIEDLSSQCERRLHSLKASKEKFSEINVLGPAPAPLLKLRNKYRHHALIKASSSEALHSFCRSFIGDKKWIPSTCVVQIDIDPVNML